MQGINNVKVIKIYLRISRSQESQSSVADLSSGTPTLKISLSPKWLKESVHVEARKIQNPVQQSGSRPTKYSPSSQANIINSLDVSVENNC